jgi:hypothetical protein
VERPPAGHVGGGSSSPELLADGKGENRIDGGVLRRGEGSDGRRRSCVGVEGEGTLSSTVPGEKAARGGGFSSSAHRGGFHGGGGGRTAAMTCSGRGTALGRRRGRLQAWVVARSGRRFRTRSVGTVFNPPGAFIHHRPQQPNKARREATLPLTAGPHSSAFSVLKITPGQK